jgi:hypothetical protein
MHLCQHGACTCETALATDYCGDTCRAHGDDHIDDACDCGHPQCVDDGRDEAPGVPM